MTKTNESTNPKTEVPKKAGSGGNLDKHGQPQQTPKVAPDKARPADHAKHHPAEHAGKE